MKSDTPVLKDLVLVGGGHSHVAVLRRFAMRPLPGVRITTICRDVHTPYSGMLPGLVAGHYEFDEAHIDLEPLSRFAGARFYHDEVTGIDLERRRILCANRPSVPYDVLSVNIGSAPNTAAVSGARDNVVPVKPIDRFYAHWLALRDRVVARAEPARIGVVGGGAGGVELLLSVQHRLRQLLADRGVSEDRLAFHLFTDQDRVLHTHNRRVSDKFTRILADRGVRVHTGHAVVQVAPGRLCFAGGDELALDEILWVTSAGAPAWIGEAGLAVDEHGFIQVDDCLQSTSHPGVFAAGDIAASVAFPRPKSGVFAVRQGPPLARNLRRALLGQTLRRFVPQKSFLGLVSTGDRYAVASRGSWALEGRWVWTWKDWIDRRFMAKYNDLPEMRDASPTPVAAGLAGREVLAEISAFAMRCGGCGAKVGASVLNRAIGSLEPVARDDVLIGLHEPDDAAVVEVPPGKVMVHTVDAFRAFIDDPYVFGKVAANHALGDIYAMGGEPQTALAIATLAYGIEEQVEEQLNQMMTGAMEVLREANAALVGGHTSEGPELSLGFSVNGLVDRARIMRKGGMQAGDCLVLTKPLGTGALFAADMRLKAKGRWIDAALRSMVQSNRVGAELLHRHGATACTDVTGFGLLGHLVEMTRPSGVDAELDLSALPIMDGALEVIGAGIMSSLQPQNVRLRRAIRDLDRVSGDARYPVIFDPQTAGGLLASVPEGIARTCVGQLHDAGYADACIIGRVLPMSGGVEAIALLT